MQVNLKAPANRKVDEKLAEMKTDALIQKVMKASFSEIDTYVDNHVTNLASARTLMKKMLVVITYLLNTQGKKEISWHEQFIKKQH